MASTPVKTRPPVTALTEPYWEGCRQGELRLQQCEACERHQFYPRVICSHCGHTELRWTVSSGRGRIASFSVVRRPISEAYDAPTIVVLVDLDEGPRMMSSLVDAEPENVGIGKAVTVDFSRWSEAISMPVFRIETEETEA